MKVLPRGNRLGFDMKSEELDFELPAELIAQTPAAQRSASRLLHYRKASRFIDHRAFAELPKLLHAGDLLVFNDTKVLPARFVLRKASGGRVEGLFLRQITASRWLVLLKNLGTHRQAMEFEAAKELSALPVAVVGEGQYEIEVSTEEPAETILDRVGRMPLPPYIKRREEDASKDDLDRERYQTVFAKIAGSVAAPTAGLHFTPQMLAELESAGVRRAFVTLHVGMGTFKPVTAATLAEHVMHAEAYEIRAEAAKELNLAKAEGRRIVAVGTTSARVLESHPSEELWRATKAQTSIFIYPPYSWRHVGALITNFHLPRSTLIAMVAAMVGLGEQRRIYAEAIARRYRFFSYGDAVLIE
jgi:S-adenosylmethionine:tRNA ribosyltransferase-isomerase